MSITKIDTHAHLADTSFDIDLSAVLANARGKGVDAVICVSETIVDARKNLQLAEKHQLIRPAAGLYPEFAAPEAAQEMYAFIRENSTKLLAIGEVGLDYWLAKEEEERETQKEILKGFIELGKELELPLNIHSRSAGRHVVSLLLDNNADNIQLHAFDGKWSAAMPAVEAGFFFSVPPSIVRSRQKQKLVKQLPLSCLLLESDSPVLGPDQGIRNEPANITVALQAISEIKGVSIEEVQENILANTLKLYPGIIKV